MSYSEKLKSPKWQKKRLKILERDNFKCNLCGDEETQLHVHHLKYTGNPYDAPDKDLETLCSDCHTLRHSVKEIVSDVVKIKEYGQNVVLVYSNVLGCYYSEVHKNKIIHHGGFFYNSEVLKAINKLNKKL